MQMISRGLIAFLLITLQATALPLLSRNSGSVESPSWFVGSGPRPGKGRAPGTSAPSSRYRGYLPAAVLLWLFRRNFPEMLPSPRHGNKSRNSGADLKSCCSHFAAGFPKIVAPQLGHEGRRQSRAPRPWLRAAAPARPSSAIYCHTRGSRAAEGKG